MTSEPDVAHAVGLDVVAVSHRGLVREQNEDALGLDGWALTAREGVPLHLWCSVTRPIDVLVADGMGGHRGGAEASRHAVTQFGAIQASIADALFSTSEAIRQRATDHPDLAGMGTTLVGLRVTPDGAATVFNVGDSRAYRMVEGYLGQLSTDDRPADQSGANKGVVTQSLGGDRAVAVEPHLLETRVAPGDRLFLCTDGVHDVVTSEQLSEFLRQPAQDAAEGLIAAVLAAGAPDNASFLVVDVFGA